MLPHAFSCINRQTQSARMRCAKTQTKQKAPPFDQLSVCAPDFSPFIHLQPSRNPQPLEPGRCTVQCGPPVVANRNLSDINRTPHIITGTLESSLPDAFKRQNPASPHLFLSVSCELPWGLMTGHSFEYVIIKASQLGIFSYSEASD